MQRGRYGGLLLPPPRATLAFPEGGHHHISRVVNLLIAPTGEFSHTLKRQSLLR